MKSRLSLFAASLALVSTFASSPGPLAAAPLGSAWDDAITQAEREILDGDFGAARKRMIRTADDMVQHLGPGKGGEILFALVSLYRALAEAGLGNRDDALWYWHVALAFNPLLLDFALDRFGEPGRYLLDHPPLYLGGELPGGDTLEKKAEAEPADAAAAITPPRSKRRPRPNFPTGARYFGITGALIVQVVITEEGEVIQPRVFVPLPAATLSWAALEALHRWRFEPARMSGRPIKAYYNLTVNYRLGE